MGGVCVCVCVVFHVFVRIVLGLDSGGGAGGSWFQGRGRGELVPEQGGWAAFWAVAACSCGALNLDGCSRLLP